VDSTRPLAFYQVDTGPSLGNGLRLLKAPDTGSVTITTEVAIPAELAEGSPTARSTCRERSLEPSSREPS